MFSLHKTNNYLITISQIQLQPCRYNYVKDILPKGSRRVFRPDPDKIQRIEARKSAKLKQHPHSQSPRINKLNIQMLSHNLYRQIFKPNNITTTTTFRRPEVLEECLRSLNKHNVMPQQQTTNNQDDVDFKMPPLLGANIAEHFQLIAEQQLKPYADLIARLLHDQKTPTRPARWLMQLGWTRYAPGMDPEPVPYPLEPAMVFDIEVCMVAGKAPTLATAVTDCAWYGWVSEQLISGVSKPPTVNHYSLDGLIPLESTTDDCDNSALNKHMIKPKIIVGHNVSFDRARIKEQYWLQRTGTRFIDTMSLHVCVSGVTSFQRTILKSQRDEQDAIDEEEQHWKQCGSLNNLVDVYKLYCGDKRKLSKETRNLFIEGTLSDIKAEFQDVMNYCCADVTATYDILTKLYPLFKERFPHPVTLAGMLELSTAYLPVNLTNWTRYIDDSEQTYQDLETESVVLLGKRADQACQLLHDKQYEHDLWMWNEDWGVKELKMRKQQERVCTTSPTTTNNDDTDELDLDKKFAYLLDTRDSLSSVKTLLPGYPNWYRKLCTKPPSDVNTNPNWVPGPLLISTSMRITPKLLSLTWEGYPLHYLKDKGWGFIIPYADDIETYRKLPLAKLLENYPIPSNKSQYGDVTRFDNLTHLSSVVESNLHRKEYYSRAKSDKTDGLYKGTTGIWCNHTIEDCCWFFKLPHKNGAAYNVGNPLAKDFLTKFSESVLAGDTDSAERVLALARMLSYWRNNRQRIIDQIVVCLDSSSNYGAIIPQIVVCGTLTRRAVEPTWMTASNAHPERIGSELRAMIQAPAGYNFIGADVDSQELWIASIIGDAFHAGMHGCTPLGWMTLSGNKANGTDMHSVTAKAVGISRDHAKVINYARIYGAGQNFAERLLKQFNPTLSDGEAKAKATKMFNLTKGKKIFHLKPEYLKTQFEDFPDQAYTKWQVFEMAKVHGKTVDEMFSKPRWVGGTESAMFNRLEDIANSTQPTTPFLNGRLSRALEPNNNGGSTNDKYLPTRINWVVQSGAVDFLHLMLVSMRWLINDKVRFCLSFHDEVRYLVPEQYKYQTALALHLTNLLTRSFCATKLGINDLPQSVAFFSSVEIDRVLRKDAQNDFRTPSNPHGLDNGYNIPHGESLDVYQAVHKAAGQCSFWYESLKDGKS